MCAQVATVASGELEGQVVIRISEQYFRPAEVRCNWFGRPLAGISSSAQCVAALYDKGMVCVGQGWSGSQQLAPYLSPCPPNKLRSAAHA